MRRPIAVAATASGGATTAPIAKATPKSRPSAHCRKIATPSAVKSTSPTDRLRMTPRLLRKSTSEVWIAAAYSRGGRIPSSTTSGLRATSGTNGRYEPEDADDDEDERRRQVEAVGEPRPPEDGGCDREQPDGDLHVDILPHAATRCVGRPSRTKPA